METTTPFTDALLSQPRASALRSIHPERLRRLLRLRRQYEHELNARGLRLLDRAVFAAYCDCRDIGTGEQARALLREAHVPVDAPTAQLSFLDLTARQPHRPSPAFGPTPAEGSTQEARPKG